MKVSTVWEVNGIVLLSSGETHERAFLVADSFQEATELAPEALGYGFGRGDLEIEVTELKVAVTDARMRD